MKEIPSETVYIRPYPANIKERDKYLFDHLIERKIIVQVKERVLKNAFINYDGHIWTGLRLVKDVSFYLRKNTIKNYYIEFKHILKNRLLKKTVKVNKACWVIDIWSHNYGHFLLDFMQRYIQVGLKYPGGLTVILPENYKKYDYLIAILNELKIQFIYLKESQIIKVKTLFIPNFYWPPGIINNEIIVHVRKAFYDLVKNKNINQETKRIFISRNNYGRRKILNEKDIIPFMKKNDFTICDMSDLSVIDQVSLCMNAEIIVGLHGAGLINMLFMKKGKILELRMQGAIDQWSIFELASALEHKYYYLLCEPATSNTDPYQGDVLVNTTEFENLLLSILEK